MKNIAIEIGYLVVALAVWFVAGEIAFSAMKLPPKWRFALGMDFVPAFVLAFAALSAVITLSYLRDRRLFWPKLGTVWQHSFYGFFSVAAVVVGALCGLLDGRYVIRDDSPNPWVFLLPQMLSVALSAFGEELLYRQILLSTAQRTTGCVLCAWVLQSLAFAFMHAPVTPWFYIAGGLWLGAVRSASGSIFVATTAHISLNVAVCLLFGAKYLGVTNGLLSGTASAYRTSTATCLVILATAVWLSQVRGYAFQKPRIPVGKAGCAPQ